MHDRGDGIEEGELGFAGERLDRLRQRRRGEGAGRHDDAVPIGRREPVDFLPDDGDEGMALERRADLPSEAVAIDGERATGRKLVTVGGRHDQGMRAPHLLMQQPDGIVGGVVGAERIGADELGESVGLMRLRRPRRAHLVERDGHGRRGELPGGLAAGKTAADDVNLLGHDRS